jgi:predicted AlkP superfamily phosphohydrolase/phosphomutase
MTDSRRLLVLGIDAANSALLKRGAADGSLPNIGRLMASGLTADTLGPDVFYLGSTWPSFYTGVSAAGHGIYWLEQLKSGTYEVHALTESDFARRPALWEVLSEHGRRMLVLDVPLSRLSPTLRGRQVVEWRTHDVVFGTQTTPASLKERILASYGEHPGPAPCDSPGRSVAECRAMADALIRGAGMRATLTRELLAEEPWDFAIQVFNEAHCAGHQLWHFHDPAHPGYDSATTAATGDLVDEVYRAIDAAIGEILQDAGADTTVVLMTLHGMSFYAGSSRLLREMLTRLGVMNAPSLVVPATTLSSRDRIRNLLRSIYHRIPESIRLPFYRLRSQVKRSVLGRGSAIPIDPLHTKCFAVEVGPNVGGIRLNLVGREPSGVLTPGAEADQFCAELTEQLMAFVEPGTGRKLVRRVMRTAERYRGEFVDELPDLVVEWDLERPRGSTVVGTGADSTFRAESARTGLIEVVNAGCRSGDHRIEGMVVATGPGLAHGHLQRAVSTLDLAPTFAAMFGAEMPDVDGTVIPELVAAKTA